MVGQDPRARQRVCDLVEMSHRVPTTCIASGAAGGSALERLIHGSVRPERPSLGPSSAIDMAYGGLLVVTQLAVDCDSRWNTQHGLILSSSAVAVAEDYFRSILVGLAEVCPHSRGRVGSLPTRLEFVSTGSFPDALRSVLELTSFSSGKNLREWTTKIAGMKIPNEAGLSRLLDDFDKVSHVRHCAVHAGGYVSPGNASTLGVPGGSWISLASSAAIHEIVAVLTAVIRSYNQTLFEDVLSRWINAGDLNGTWQEDRGQFSALWRLFASRADRAGGGAGAATIAGRAYDAYRTIQGDLLSRWGRRWRRARQGLRHVRRSADVGSGNRRASLERSLGWTRRAFAMEALHRPG